MSEEQSLEISCKMPVCLHTPFIQLSDRALRSSAGLKRPGKIIRSIKKPDNIATLPGFLGSFYLQATRLSQVILRPVAFRHWLAPVLAFSGLAFLFDMRSISEARIRVKQYDF